jgi:predicted transcriptional regulator
MLDDDTIKHVQEMREKGASINRIARELGLSRPTIYKYLSPTHDDPEAEQTYPAPESEQGAGHTYLPTKKKVPEIHPKVAEAKANAEVLEWKIEEEKNRQKLEEVVTGPKEHPALAKKKARVEVAKLDLDEYQARKQLKKLKTEELEKAKAEQEEKIQRETERKRLEEERRRIEQHRHWIEEQKAYALNYCIPFGLDVPVSVKFQIKDKVGEVVKNRGEGEDRWTIQHLIEETVEEILKPLVDEKKARQEAEELRRKEAEARRKEEKAKEERARKIKQIQKALEGVDLYISQNRLEPYVNEEVKKKINAQIYTQLLEVLPEGIFYTPTSEVRELLDLIFWDTKQKKKEAEEKQKSIQRLIEIGMNRLSIYILKYWSELAPFEPGEQEEAKQHLEKKLTEEIQGDEGEQEVRELVDEILNEYFFED